MLIPGCLVGSSFMYRLLKQKEIVMNKVVECGIDGMECFPPGHHRETGSEEYLSFAHTNHLIATSGSDYHGNYSLFR